MLDRTLLPLLLVGLMILAVQAEVDPVPAQTEALLIPQPTDNQGPILEPSAIPRSPEQPHFEKPMNPIHLPFPGPSRMK